MTWIFNDTSRFWWNDTYPVQIIVTEEGRFHVSHTGLPKWHGTFESLSEAKHAFEMLIFNPPATDATIAIDRLDDRVLLVTLQGDSGTVAREFMDEDCAPGGAGDGCSVDAVGGNGQLPEWYGGVSHGFHCPSLPAGEFIVPSSNHPW